MKDAWESGDPYEYFMGRWSCLVAQSFVDWLSLASGLKWLDVGCGSGALSEAVVAKYKPAELTAIDQSESFVESAQKRLGSEARCRVGDALALPLQDAAVDVTVSGLVLNFIPAPEKALAEMRRVTAPGGTVAVYIWDYAGRMDFLTHFWNAAAELDAKAAPMHEGTRFPDANAEALAASFAGAGLLGADVVPIEIDTHFRDFDDYWKPFLGGQRPAPTYALSLSEPKRDGLRDTLRERLPIQEDGSIPMVARAWAARGQV